MRYDRNEDAPWDARRWPNFSPRELACKCGGRFCDGAYWHDPDFLDGLQAMRQVIGPLVINSGHRCPQWNAIVGGAPQSRHKQIAADICLVGHDRFLVRDVAGREGFTGIGCGQTFLHVDRRARPARWFYGARSRAAWRR